MNLLLCCNADSLRNRWLNALDSGFTVYEATRLADLGGIVHRIAMDIMLIHHSMVDLEDVAYIRKTLPTCRLFILADRPEETEGLALIRLGVVGYANSYITAQGLREALKVVANGSVWINQKLMQRLITVTSPPGHEKPTSSGDRLEHESLLMLSNREYQIARLIADGLSNLEIAAELNITERTVKAHLSAIYAKTSTRGRLNLALLINQRQ